MIPIPTLLHTWLFDGVKYRLVDTGTATSRRRPTMILERAETDALNNDRWLCCLRLEGADDDRYYDALAAAVKDLARAKR